MTERWAAVGVPDRLTDGGSLRAWHVFRELIRRTNALEFYRPSFTMLHRAASRLPSLAPGVRIAAAELLPQVTVGIASHLTDLQVLDLHDHPVGQREALGLTFESGERKRLERLVRSNVQAFQRIIVVSESFGELAGVPKPQTLVVPNGSDTHSIRPVAWPLQPAVGFVSGAAPGRGIESLVRAMRLVREEIKASLLLGLVAVGSESMAYLERLRSALAREPWVEVHTVPYQDVGVFLGRSSVLCIPHPPGRYMDAAMPVKVFDSMAAGRPLVVTPRIETARLVTSIGCGVVAKSDGAPDVASALLSALRDESAAQRMGAAARYAAEQRFDWGVLAQEVADALLGSVPSPGAGH